MGREIKTDGLKLESQLLHGRPICELREIEAIRLAEAMRKKTSLLVRAITSGRAGLAQEQFDRSEGLPSIGADGIERSGRDQALQRPLVERSGIASPSKV